MFLHWKRAMVGGTWPSSVSFAKITLSVDVDRKCSIIDHLPGSQSGACMLVGNASSSQLLGPCQNYSNQKLAAWMNMMPILDALDCALSVEWWLKQDQCCLLKPCDS